jgi:hypothetical protein
LPIGGILVSLCYFILNEVTIIFALQAKSINMKFSILYVIIPLAFISSCVNKNNTEKVETDPNELKNTPVESADSLAAKGLGNYKAIEILSEDLDGDKVKEHIAVRVGPAFFQKDNDNPMGIVEMPAIISIGKQFIRTSLHVNSFYENGKSFTIAIKDINIQDNFKEVIFIPSIHGIDPPGDYQVLRYINGQMRHFKLPGDSIENDQLNFTNNGKLAIKYTIGSDKGIDPVTGEYKANDISKIFTLSKNGIKFMSRDTGKVYMKQFTQ